MQKGWMFESDAITPQIEICAKELAPMLMQGAVESWIQRMPVQQVLVSLTRMLMILCADDAGMAAPDEESVNHQVKEL